MNPLLKDQLGRFAEYHRLVKDDNNRFIAYNRAAAALRSLPFKVTNIRQVRFELRTNRRSSSCGEITEERSSQRNRWCYISCQVKGVHNIGEHARKIIGDIIDEGFSSEVENALNSSETKSIFVSDVLMFKLQNSLVI